MQETRTMQFEALKQAVIDLNMSTDNILVPAKAEIISLIVRDLETAEKMTELFSE